MFPIIDTELGRGVTRRRAVAAGRGSRRDVRSLSSPRFEALAKQIAARQPYLPLIAIDPDDATLPENAIPFSQSGGNFDRLTARLRAALRVRTLHSTVMRRLDDDPAAAHRLRRPIRSATPPCC